MLALFAFILSHIFSVGAKYTNHSRGSTAVITKTGRSKTRKSLVYEQVWGHVMSVRGPKRVVNLQIYRYCKLPGHVSKSTCTRKAKHAPPDCILSFMTRYNSSKTSSLKRPRQGASIKMTKSQNPMARRAYVRLITGGATTEEEKLHFFRFGQGCHIAYLISTGIDTLNYSRSDSPGGIKWASAT